MNSTPQVETVEISDSELDNVSGGLQVNTLNSATGTLNGVAPAVGSADVLVGAVEGVTGLHTAPVQGLVASL